MRFSLSPIIVGIDLDQSVGDMWRSEGRVWRAQRNRTSFVSIKARAIKRFEGGLKLPTVIMTNLGKIIVARKSYVRDSGLFFTKKNVA